MPNGLKRVLFVCLGNICRSPAAEGVLKKLLADRNLQNRIEVDSAGTSSYHLGEPADRRMRAAAQRRGMQLMSRSRMISQRDFLIFDLIIAMDSSNYRELMNYDQSGEGKVRLLSDFLDDSWPREVPDPYFGGETGFEEVLDLLEAACPKLLDALLAE
jgi:protein-tyrosine phosphatase